MTGNTDQDLAPKVIGARSLTAIGLGGLVGAGIFVTVGMAAREQAGPAVILSFLLAAVACIAVALCYCECASRVPVAGSNYAYGRAAIGELGGWVSGWNLATCYLLAGAAVAQGWSGYFRSMLGAVGASWPDALGSGPIGIDPATGALSTSGAILDLPALLSLLAVTVVVYRGLKLSLRVNNLILALKLTVLGVVVLVGLSRFQLSNWQPFAPFGFGGLSLSSFSSGSGAAAAGVLAAATTVFFAFGGFEMMSAYSADCRRPRRDVPLAIIAAVSLLTLLYVLVAAAITGMVPYTQISVSAPVSDAFKTVGMGWMQIFVAVGALAGLTSVLLVVVMSFPRVLMGIARDGMLPRPIFEASHPVYGTPHRSIILVGTVAILLAALLPLRLVMNAVMMSTLAGYVSICLFVIILRARRNSPEPEFRAPLGLMTPLFGAAACLLLMFAMPPATWILVGGWWALAVAVYAFIRRRSALAGDYAVVYEEERTPTVV